MSMGIGRCFGLGGPFLHLILWDQGPPPWCVNNTLNTCNKLFKKCPDFKLKEFRTLNHCLKISKIFSSMVVDRNEIFGYFINAIRVTSWIGSHSELQVSSKTGGGALAPVATPVPMPMMSHVAKIFTEKSCDVKSMLPEFTITSCFCKWYILALKLTEGTLLCIMDELQKV